MILAASGECPKGFFAPDGTEPEHPVSPFLTGYDGSALWAALHTAIAPDQALIDHITASLTCGPCKTGWLQMLTESPPVFAPLSEWGRWVVDRHNQVNRKLLRKEWSYAESDARWPLP